MTGKIAAISIVLSAVVAGVTMVYLQLYAFYYEVDFPPGREMSLTTISGEEQAIPVESITGINADSSPIRFRACFVTSLTSAELIGRFQAYAGAEPLVAPGWFDCFDAQSVGHALERGEAHAFLSRRNIQPDVDRVVAVFPDGRAYAWHQFNLSAKDK